MTERNESLDYIKAIAIFSVFCVHCSGVVATDAFVVVLNLIFIRSLLVYSIMAVAVVVLNRLITDKPKLEILLGVNR